MFALAAPPPVAGQEGTVRTLPLGVFTVYVAERPFRLSWFYRDELLFAERYHRHRGALEVFSEAGWSPLIRLVDARPAAGEEVGETRWRLRAVGPKEQKATIVLSWLPTRAAARFSCVFDDGVALGWRQDFVAQPGELRRGVRDATFSRLRLAGVDDAPVPGRPPRPEKAAVISSRGFGLLIDGAVDQVDIFRPDPDAWRLQVRRRAYGYSIVPGDPETVLRARHREVVPETTAGVLPSRCDALDEFLLPAREPLAVDELNALLPSTLAAWMAAGPACRDGIPSVLPLCFLFPRHGGSWIQRDVWILRRDVLLVRRLDPSGLELPPGRWLRVGTGGLSATGARRLGGEAARKRPLVFVREGSVPAKRYAAATARRGSPGG